MKRLRPFLPKPCGKPRADDRLILSGIIHMSRCGFPWNHAPKEYGPWTTLYNRWK